MNRIKRGIMTKQSTVTHQNKKFVFTSFNDHIGNILSKGSFYEIGMLRAIQDLKLGGTFLDIGAFIGTHSVFFSKFCADKVISFEAFDQSYDLLVKNLTQCDNNCTAYNFAVSDKAGRCSVNIRAEDNLGMNEIIEGEEVEVVNIDMFQYKNVTLMKIDVEGNELKVLQGAIDTIRHCKPEIFIETSDRKVLNFLKSLGYKHKTTYNATPTHHYSCKY